MRAHYKTANGRMTFEVEGENAKAIFRELSSIQEIFDAEKQCGVCHGTEIRLLARKVESFDFYELACLTTGCRARFGFGQAKTGGALFPKRRDEDGNWLPNGGWSRYEPQAMQQAQPEPAPQPQNRPQPVAAPSQVRPQPQAVPMQTGTRNQTLSQNQQQAPPQYNRNQPRPTEEWTVSDSDIPF